MKSTKKSFIGALLALVICFTMLVGSTLAWFTDSASVSIQTITTGELNLTVEDGADDTANSLEGQTLTWQAKDGRDQDKIFWEPGATYVTNEFYIKNEGNLNLKFKIVLNLPEDNMLLDVVSFNVLAESNQVRFNYVDDQGDVQFVRPLGKVDLLTGFEIDNGVIADEYTLLPGDVVGPLTVKAYMDKSAGNDYMNKILDQIGFTIVATQSTGDMDSYNGSYDDGIILRPGFITKGEGTFTSDNGIELFYPSEDSASYQANEVYLYNVTEDYTETTFTVPENVTVIGSNAFASNSNIEKVIVPSTVESMSYAFENSTVAEVVLEEGIETIDSRTFVRTYGLEKVEIPSTVTVIEDNAFQKTALKEIVIPATVETIGETSFGSSAIEKVIFEGNTSIEGYAFRGCKNLHTVVMKGDNNEFVPSRLNGRNSMWFCNGESNNPNTSDITFYVQNETVAQRVMKAMGAEAENTDVYIGDDGEQVLKYVYVKNAAQLQTALDSAVCDTIITFTAGITGDVTVNQKVNVDFVIDGNNKIFKGLMTIRGGGRATDSDTLLIKNTTFVAKDGEDSCIESPEYTATLGHPNTHNVTIEGCTFKDEGTKTQDAAAIRQCDNGDRNWTIKNCIVESSIHSLLQVNNVGGKLSVQGCTVNSKNGINLVSTPNVEVIGCNFDNIGYNVRFGVNSGGNGPEVVKTFLIKDCTLDSENDDNDGNITIRKDAQTNSTLTLENVTFISVNSSLEIVGSVTNLVK